MTRLDDVDPTVAVDVIVPAHDEEALIGACLRSVLWDADGLDLRLIVAANGCSDGTVAVVREMEPLVRDLSHELVTVELPRASKAAALNTAEEHARGVTTIYLDGDTVLLPGALPSLLRVLAQPRPVLASPRRLLFRPRAPLARGFAAVWSRLPAVAGDVVGAGCYAVNALGRARWGRFPEVTADDAFVRGRFGRGERFLVEDGAFLLVLPEGRELHRVVGRWRRGNRELANGEDPSAGLVRNATWALTHPRLWTSLPAFAVVSVASRVRAGDTGRWERAASTRRGARPEAHRLRPSVGVLGDGEGDGGGDDDYVLLVDPDVRLEPRALDHLLVVAMRFPGAGLYGGCPEGGRGRLAGLSCLGEPRLRHALAFAVLGPPRWEGVERVAVLSRACLLVERALWDRLGGLDDRLGCHRQGVDLCLRARGLGASPIRTSSVRYSRGSDGSADAAEETVAMLTASAALYSDQLPRWQRPIARTAVAAGVAVRAAIEPRVWGGAWRRRAEWSRAGSR